MANTRLLSAGLESQRISRSIAKSFAKINLYLFDYENFGANFI